MEVGAYARPREPVQVMPGRAPSPESAANSPSEEASIATLSSENDTTRTDQRWLKELGITTSNPSVYRDAWATEEDKLKQRTRRWNQTYTGRLAIRSVSRGIVGAAFYTAGQLFANKELKNYTTNDDAKPQNVLQHVARIIDKTVGAGIQWSVGAVTKNPDLARNAVTFRDTVNYGYRAGTDIKMGRSLGHEAVAITFDFASMSFGDYMTRYVIGLLDPNVKSKWMKDGHIDLPGGLKDVLRNLWTGITYAAGEDMAVAIPYVYYMKLQRGVINHFSPGFKYDFDLGRNGGSFKTREARRPDGTLKAEVIGDYQMEGMLDLMGRFSWYNVGTKMFRDFYNAAGNHIGRWWQGGHKIGLPQLDPNLTSGGALRSLGQKITHGINYVVRTTIKTMTYMVPATFFFYITRTPQTQVRGLAIDPKKGPLGWVERGSAPESDALGAEVTSDVRVKVITPGSEYGRAQDVGGKAPAPGSKHLIETHHRDQRELVDHPFTGDRRDSFANAYYEASGVKPPWHTRITNPIAAFCYNAGSMVNRGLQGVLNRLPLSETAHAKYSGFLEKFARTLANASLSYTPYFMMKSDVLSAAWDTRRMDMAIDRMLAGLARFNLKEFFAGMDEVVRTVLKQPFRDPRREELADFAMTHDTEAHSNEAYQSAVAYRGAAAGTRTEAKTAVAEELRAHPPTLTPLRAGPVATSGNIMERLEQLLSEIDSRLDVSDETKEEVKVAAQRFIRELETGRPGWQTQADVRKLLDNLSPQHATMH